MANSKSVFASMVAVVTSLVPQLHFVSLGGTRSLTRFEVVLVRERGETGQRLSPGSAAERGNADQIARSVVFIQSSLLVQLGESFSTRNESLMKTLQRAMNHSFLLLNLSLLVGVWAAVQEKAGDRRAPALTAP